MEVVGVTSVSATVTELVSWHFGPVLRQDVAISLGHDALDLGLDVEVMAMDDYGVAGLPVEDLVVMVVATTGDGVAPDNMTVSQPQTPLRGSPDR